MEFVILDLEWNSGYSPKTESYLNEIIEFGAVKLNEKMELIDTFSMLVRPVITRRLNPMVRRLTSLKDRDVKNGEPFTRAFRLFRRFLGDAVLLSWSKSDLSALSSNCAYYFGSERIPGVRLYADLQLYCQDMLRLEGKNSLSLLGAYQLLEPEDDRSQNHRASDDCLLAAECLRRLYLRAAMLCYLCQVDEAFYTYLHHQLSQPYSLEEYKSMLRGVHFTCPRCGCRSMRRGGWRLKGRGYAALFQCPSCSLEFHGKTSFRRKHDRPVLIKHLYTPEDESKEVLTQSRPEAEKD